MIQHLIFGLYMELGKAGLEWEVRSAAGVGSVGIWLFEVCCLRRHILTGA